MIGLLLIGFVAGLIAGVSPCILPVLPVVFAGWTSGPMDGDELMMRRRRRAVAVVAGLVLSFSIITLAGTAALDALGLPLDVLRNLGIVLLIVLGLGLLIPRLEALLERPFVRFVGRTPSGTGSGFALGVGLGAVFVPCAGPVLSAITVLGATKHVGIATVALTACFATGAALPLLAIALAGDRMIERNRALRERARRLRPVGGALLIVMALAINFNVVSSFQRWLPGYTAALQRGVEENSYAASHLRELRNPSATTSQITDCVAGSTTLATCGRAPDFVGISSWLNTPGGKPLSISTLSGRVVLVDFWTYSCINCQRTLAHLESWYQRYHSYGLEIVGVHSPEFAFEHVVANVRTAARQLGVNYPVAVDNNLDTWNSYANQYWPAEYLVDAKGVVRHSEFGEGNYPLSESLIRSLLTEANPDVQLPLPTVVADATPYASRNPETYLGYERSQYFAGNALIRDRDVSYDMTTSLPEFAYGLGGHWNVHSQFMTSGDNARLRLDVTASKVYVVLGGSGKLIERFNGVTRVVNVSGIPRLYTLIDLPTSRSGVLDLTFSRGVSAYAFTFG